MLKQHTIHQTIQATGIGLHSGLKVTLILHPAPVNTGIVLRRIDLNPVVCFPIKATDVGDTRLASVLIKEGVRISTVEHLLSACAGLGIDNMTVDLTTDEVPIMDGSAASFVFLLRQAGMQAQQATKQFIRVIKPIEVHEGQGNAKKWASLSPHHGFKLRFFIEFHHPAVDASGQTAEMDFSVNSYSRDIARARTFGFVQEVETLRGMGLARGGSLENAIVMDEYRILNAEGLRYKNEFIRHKILDAIGDLYLIGYPLLASYHAHKAGHTLNNQLLRALLAQPDSYEKVAFNTEEAAPLAYRHQIAQEWGGY